ncbi:carboxypeptidase-like regulatory domain-containing protein [uncultured Sunxiuqinia sp.]|uniref:carboxypeptidase-like regulatory domain-containing protein n=1 Tax=uncultured Sunxiuqinia sp. TaxID=1573825 RepID=UPI00263868FD|nr:carboxypeptidase-like regulatory domain-containing protein [uncultured Sunxiuqinia sp.]
MKPKKLITNLLLLFLPFSIYAQEQQVIDLQAKVSVQVEHAPLLDLLNQISSQTGIYFSYDPMLVNTHKLISIHLQNQPLEAVLKAVFNEKYHFNLLKNQLIITSRKASATSQISTQPPSIRYNLSGSLQDSQSRELIPYGSISVLGHPFGTISNVDGEFNLKIPPEYESDTLVISCMGYARRYLLLDTLQHNPLNILLDPVEIKLREVKVTAVDALQIMDKLDENIAQNYPTNNQLMTSFYREVLKQDNDYINVSEAIMDILKIDYTNRFREDQIRFLKGRKSPEVEPSFHLVDFKMQGGPYYINKLDVIKTMDSFIDKEFRNYYSYAVEQVISYENRPTYVVLFKPNAKIDNLTYKGKLYVDQETFALVHAEFSLSRDGKKSARRSLIKKKPHGFRVRPIDLDYSVSYKQHHNKWYFSTAQASVKFHVKSRHDKINSVFHSVSDLLVTDHRATNLRRFKRQENFNSSDIFSEIISDYDENFWGNYNVIKPSEDLRKALKKAPQTGSVPQPHPQPLTTQNNQP